MGGTKTIAKVSLFTAIIEQYLFSGLILGWASLVYIMKEEKFFADLCDETTGRVKQLEGTCSKTCAAQDARFNKIFIIAVTTYELASALLGYVFDRIGTGYTRILITIGETVGLVLMAMTTSATTWMLYPATLLIGICGLMVLITNMQLANMFVTKRSTVLTLLNGVFDSSSCTFMLLKVLYENGFTYKQLFLSLAGLTVIMWFRTFFLMPKWHIPWPIPRFYTIGLFQWREGCSSEPIDDFEVAVQPNSDSDLVIADKEQKSVLPYVGSITFISFNIWFIMCNLRHVFFISSVNTLLTGYDGADCAFVSKWTTYFGIFQFCGVLFAPLAGGIIDITNSHYTKNGFLQTDAQKNACGVSLILTSLLGIIFSVLSASTFTNPSDGAIAATFVLETAFRAFLYGSQANFISMMFPSELFGSLYGISMFVGGITGFASIPLFDLVIGPLNSQFYFIDWFFIIIISCGTIWPTLVNITCFNY